MTKSMVSDAIHFKMVESMRVGGLMANSMAWEHLFSQIVRIDQNLLCFVHSENWIEEI
jgi:hypothetical protein